MTRLLFFVVVLAAVACAQNATDDNNTTATNTTTTTTPDDANATTPNATTGNLTLSGSEFSKLTKLIQFAEATTLLERTEPFTLFAPNDAAFDATGVELRDPMLEGSDSYEVLVNALKRASGDDGKSTARQLLNYHVVADGKFTLEQLNARRTFLTAQGRYLAVSDGRVIDASFTSADPQIGAVVAETDTAIVYRIDSVLFPFAIVKSDSKSEGGGGDGGGGGGVGGGGGATGGGRPPPPSAGNQGSAAGSEAEPSGGRICFPGTATVYNADGASVQMERLKGGDVVRVDEHGASSAIIAFTHRKSQGFYRFVSIETARTTLEISGEHYVYANGEPVRADAVKVGDWLRVAGGETAVVLRVGAVMRRGLFAPHTRHGDIVVNGVVCSTYTALLPHTVAHATMAAVRALSRIGLREPLGTLFYDGMPKLSRNLAINPSWFGISGRTSSVLS